MLSVLRGQYGLLWAGQTVSLIGDSVFLVAFTWQIAVEWRRPALLGVLLGARVLAELVSLGLGGWIIDRVPRRSTVMLTDALRGFLLLALATELHQPIPVASLALLVAAFGLLTGLFRPALLALVPEVAPRPRLAAANSLLALSQQTAIVLGPALGAGLVGLGSAATALRLDGISFLIAALATFPLSHRRPASTTGGVLAQVAEGFRAARRVSWVGGAILLFSVVNIGTISAERLALPRAAQERFGQLGGYGAMLVAIGVGSVLAALVVGRSSPGRHSGRTAYSGLLLFGAATVSFGLARGVVAAVLIGLAFGFGQQFFDLLWTTGLQQYVPDRLLGRISAVDQFGSFLFLPLSFAFGGLLVQSIQPELVLLAAGVAGLLAAAIGFSVPALYRWRPFPDEIAGLAPATTTTTPSTPTQTVAPAPRNAGAERSESRAQP